MPGLTARPAGVVIEIGPVTRPLGTTALMLTLLLTIKLTAGVPLKLTRLAPRKFVPVMTIRAPGAALVDDKDLILAGR